MIDDENEAVSRSIYVRHMRKWLDKFKPNQIHVVSGEQVMGAPKVQWMLDLKLLLRFSAKLVSDD